MSDKRLEFVILKNLVKEDVFARKTLPFIQDEYFAERDERYVYEQIREYFTKYNTIPTVEALGIELDSASMNDADYKLTKVILDKLYKDKDDTPLEWLVEQTEKWCKDRAIYNAVMDSIEILDEKGKRSQGEIPDLLKEALSVSFDTNIGHDFLIDSDRRYDFYHTEEEKLPFDLDYFNKITKGGLPNKTLNIALAGTGVGKTLFMGHVAANCLMMGKNVLYITMEMAEERIAERIDANLLNIPMRELTDLPKDMYDKKIERLREKTKGKLIIKEYPTAGAHVGHFRHLLQELNLKKDYKPDLIVVDYLNICTSFRVRPGSNVNSYTLVKSIAEELRGLAVEFDVPVLSATQTTRSGYSNTDIDLTDTSESFGLPATADFMFALISSEELEALDQMLVKQLKNRYNDPTMNKRFVMGVDRSRMKLYDCEQNAQEELIDNGPVFDNTKAGKNLVQKFQEFNYDA